MTERSSSDSKGLSPRASASLKSSPENATTNALYDFIGESARVLVASAVGLALIFRHDAITTLWVAGGVLNAILAKVLKRVINQARPEGARTKDPGMPSSHTMSLFYLSSFVVNALVQDMVAIDPFSAAWLARAAASALLLGYATAASAWRVKGGYHTKDQILVGGAIGTTFSLLWGKLCRDFLVDHVAAQLPDGNVPISWICGVLFLGACAVGSVERRLAALKSRFEKSPSDGEKEA